MPHALIRGDDLVYREPGGGATGLEVAVLLGAEHGAVHLETARSRLASGGQVAGHLHPFEESFAVLAGRVLVRIGDHAYELGEGDYGFAPVATPHAWHNPFDEPAEWLRLRSPQPRPIGNATGTYPAAVAPPPSGAPVSRRPDPSQRYVGHFGEDDLPPPGPLSMPGYHGQNVRNVSIAMMVDELLGARHHTLFVVEFQPSSGPVPSAKEHFHPFEEIYYFVRGSARGRVGGEACELAAGDLMFAGVNTSHGFTNSGDVPVRWIEAQAPVPPASDAFFFEEDWERLEQPGA